MKQIKKAVQEKPESGNDGQQFDKEEVLQAECLRQHRDTARALLKDGTSYTIQEAMEIISKFMKGKVR